MAKKQNVSQFIFISTANTIGYGCLTHLGTESQKIKRPFSKLHYAKSKLKAENYLLNNKQGIDLKILNPTFMIGPYDSKPSSGKIILMGLNKKVVFYPPGGKNFVPVKDVVSAIVNSFQNGKSGEKYLIAGDNMSYYDFFKKIKQISAQKQRLVPLPIPILKAIGLMGNALRLFSVKTSLGSSNMETLYIKNYYGNHKSIQELNMTYTPIDNAIKEAIGYFEQKTYP